MIYHHTANAEELCNYYYTNLLKIRKYRKCRRYDIATSLKNENSDIYTIVNEYINNIDDTITRTVFRERILRGRSWQSVALIIGGNNTADSVRKRFVRYFKKSS